MYLRKMFVAKGFVIFLRSIRPIMGFKTLETSARVGKVDHGE